MDPLSVASGVIGIASVAIHSVHTLIHDINAIKDAPEVIADLRDELAAVEAVLESLNNSHKNLQFESLTPETKTALQLAIANCQKACEKFRAKLARWTKHSGGKIDWRDRVRVGLFAEATVDALSEQLNNCKSTINAAVSTAALISTASLSSTAAAMEKALHAQEINLSQEMVEIDQQSVVAEKILKKATETQSSRGQDHSEFIDQLQDQRATLDDSRKLLEDLLKDAHQMRTGQRITNVDMSDGGKLLVGIINCEYDKGEIHQEIHNVKATSYGKGVVGIIKGFDVNTFLNN